MSKWKVVIIGAGRIAGLNELDEDRKKPCTHAGAYLNNKNFKIVGVVDNDKKTAKKFADLFKIPNAFENVSEGIKFCRPNLISVTVPYQLHHIIVAKCMRKNFLAYNQCYHY